MEHLRHILLKGAANVRDLGGYPTIYGRMTGWGRMYRADSLAELTDDDWEELKRRNVLTLIDLRSADESESSPVRAPYEADCFHCSLMRSLDEAGLLRRGSTQEAASQKFIESMKLDYSATVLDNPRGLSDVMNILLNSINNENAAIFFCSAGKDRTGIVAATVLYFCGVTEEDILADYMVSCIYNTKSTERLMKVIPPEVMEAIPDKHLLDECFASDPDTMRSLLQTYKTCDIRKLLDKNGFGYEKQKLLTEKFCESCDTKSA